MASDRSPKRYELLINVYCWDSAPLVFGLHIYSSLKDGNHLCSAATWRPAILNCRLFGVFLLLLFIGLSAFWLLSFRIPWSAFNSRSRKILIFILGLHKYAGTRRSSLFIPTAIPGLRCQLGTLLTFIKLLHKTSGLTPVTTVNANQILNVSILNFDVIVERRMDFLSFLWPALSALRLYLDALF